MKSILLKAKSADWLFDDQYYSFVQCCLLNSRKSVYVQQFVIDPRPKEDQDAKVRILLHALGDAANRGLDVRVLIARIFVGKPYPIDINEPAVRFLIKRNVQVRGYPGIHDEQMHTKAILIDNEFVIVGSHNWTPKSFNENSETSIVVNSKDSHNYLHGSFNKLWLKAEEYG